MQLSAFLGTWTLERSIADARGDRTGTLQGEARFTPVPDGLAYAETGTLSFPGAPPMQASRRYLWRAARAGGVEVFFEDGRFFHAFAEDAPAAVHACDPDTYRVRYDFGAWPRWQAEWRVTGPRKDYVMLSRYRPA